MNHSQKRFLSLIAVSSEAQATEDKASLDHQRIVIAREIDRWRSAYDCRHVEEIEVPDHSRDYSSLEEAIAGGLTQYARLRDQIKAAPKAIDVVIFFNHSRLGRDIGLSMNIVSLCQRYKIVVYGCDMPPSTLEFQKNMLTLFLSAYGSVGAHGEKEQIKERHDTGMLRRVQNGNFPHKPPWGWLERYEANGDGKPSLVVYVDEKAAKTIRMIFDLYLARGMGCPGIAAYLNAQGISAPDSPAWGETGVRWIVSRAWLFAGYVELNRNSKAGRQFIRAKSKWPAIIDDDTAQAAETERKRRISARRSVGSRHLFSQIVYCAECQRPMIAKWSFVDKQLLSGVKRYHKEVYVCKHGHRQVAGATVLRAVQALLDDPQVQAAMLAGFASAEIDTSSIDREIASYHAEIAELERSLNQATVDYYVDRRLSQSQYQVVESRIKQRKEAALAQITILEAQRRDADRQIHRQDRAEEFLGKAAGLLTQDDVVVANVELRKLLRVWVKDNEVVSMDIGL